MKELRFSVKDLFYDSLRVDQRRLLQAKIQGLLDSIAKDTIEARGTCMCYEGTLPCDCDGGDCKCFGFSCYCDDACSGFCSYPPTCGCDSTCACDDACACDA